MKALMILQELPQLFRFADVEKFTANANVFLTRALQRGLVARISRGVYVNALLKGFPPVEEAACFLRSPSYISCEWALHLHGVIIQVPVVCTVITLSTAVGEGRNVRYQGVTIEFAHIADRLFHGFELRDGFNLAVPEKALLDTIYLRKRVPFADELETDVLDLDLVKKLAEAYPATTRRLAEKVGRGGVMMRGGAA